MSFFVFYCPFFICIMYAVADRLPWLGKRELIFLLV